METVRKRRKPVAEINVVPYIDVMLVLLIVFMVTAPLLTQGLIVELPQASSEPLEVDENAETLVISITADEQYYISLGSTQQEDQSPVAIDVIGDQVSRIVGANPQIQVFVEGDGQSSYSSFISLMTVLQAEQQRVAQEQRQREQQQREAEQQRQEQQREAEQQRQQELAAEQERQRQEQAQAQARAQQEADARELAETEAELVMAYSAVIHDLVQQYWSRPPSARNGMVVVLRIRMVPTGDVLDVEIVQSSGDFAFDRAAESAVLKVNRFTELQGMDPRLFDRNFRTFLLTFRPQDLLN